MNLAQTMIHAYHPAALLRVSGADAFTFLQGQFTNELRQPVGSAVYGLWLNHKGRVVADSHVLRLADAEFLLVGIRSPAATLFPRLEAHIIADDVTLQDETTTGWGLALVGSGSGEAIKQVLGVAPREGTHGQSGGALIFPGRRTQGENYEVIGTEEIITEAGKRFLTQGCIEAGAVEVELARISAGLPAIPQDLGAGDLPNEGGLETAAISYTKGCYLGQEVMARLKNLGRVRRRLQVVRGAGDPPPPGALLYQEGKKAGEIRSSAGRGRGFVALAMLSLLNLDLKAGLSLSPHESPGIKIDQHG